MTQQDMLTSDCNIICLCQSVSLTPQWHWWLAQWRVLSKHRVYAHYPTQYPACLLCLLFIPQGQLGPASQAILEAFLLSAIRSLPVPGMPDHSRPPRYTHSTEKPLTTLITHSQICTERGCLCSSICRAGTGGVRVGVEEHCRWSTGPSWVWRRRSLGYSRGQYRGQLLKGRHWMNSCLPTW